MRMAQFEEGGREAALLIYFRSYTIYFPVKSFGC